MFNTSSKTCEIDPSQVYYTSSLNGVDNYMGNPPNIPSNNDKVVMGCPKKTPFSDGR